MCVPSTWGDRGDRLTQWRAWDAPTQAATDADRKFDRAGAGNAGSWDLGRLGSDNAAGMLSPATTMDLLDEVSLLAAAIPFYDIITLARLAAGGPIDEDQRDLIRWYFKTEEETIGRTLGRT